MIGNTLRASALALALAATPTLAAVQTFGPDSGKFSVDVPSGWSATPLADGVQLASADGNNSVAVTISKTQGATMEQIAQAVSKNSGLKEVSGEGENWTVAGEIDGVKVAVILSGAGDQYVGITMSGNDADALTKVIDSLEMK